MEGEESGSVCMGRILALTFLSCKGYIVFILYPHLFRSSTGPAAHVTVHRVGLHYCMLLDQRHLKIIREIGIVVKPLEPVLVQGSGVLPCRVSV